MTQVFNFLKIFPTPSFLYSVAKQPRQIQEPKSQAEEDKNEDESESDSEDEEIGSDTSLPLSDTGETGPSAGNTKNPVGKKPPSSEMSQDVRSVELDLVLDSLVC